MILTLNKVATCLNQSIVLLVSKFPNERLHIHDEEFTVRRCIIDYKNTIYFVLLFRTSFLNDSH